MQKWFITFYCWEQYQFKWILSEKKEAKQSEKKKKKKKEKELSDNQTFKVYDIHITKPDKEAGVVIFDHSDCIVKMSDASDVVSKFKKLYLTE